MLFYCFVFLYVHSSYFYSAASSPLLTQRLSRHSTDTVSEFHAEAPLPTANEGLAQGPYVAAKAGLEPATLWTKGAESTNELPRLEYVRLRCRDALTDC